MESSAPPRDERPRDRAPGGDTWVGLLSSPLPVAEATAWVVRPDCGGVVLFSGTARDHAAGRVDVERLEYEAYEEHVEPALRAIAGEARDRWPMLGRIVLLHRVGEVPIGESAVLVAVSAPHRPEAFEAARFCIDTIKQTVPIWKREAWTGGPGGQPGESWGLSEA
jgi:molybdopterin synthase catalytic subunit